MLRTDVIRKELLKHPKYTGKEINKIYNEMFRRATKFLEQKKSVILDATFSKKKFIKMAKDISKSYNSQLIIIQVKCKESWIQVSSATKLFLNKSIGVLNCNDFLGLLFNLFSTKRVCCSSMFLKESFLGKY